MISLKDEDRQRSLKPEPSRQMGLHLDATLTVQNSSSLRLIRAYYDRGTPRQVYHHDQHVVTCSDETARSPPFFGSDAEYFHRVGQRASLHSEFRTRKRSGRCSMVVSQWKTLHGTKREKRAIKVCPTEQTSSEASGGSKKGKGKKGSASKGKGKGSKAKGNFLPFQQIVKMGAAAKARYQADDRSPPGIYHKFQTGQPCVNTPCPRAPCCVGCGKINVLHNSYGCLEATLRVSESRRVNTTRVVSSSPWPCYLCSCRRSAASRCAASFSRQSAQPCRDTPTCDYRTSHAARQRSGDGTSACTFHPVEARRSHRPHPLCR